MQRSMVMKNSKKKGFVIRIAYFIVFVLVIILLIFLIKNRWDVGAAFKELLRFLRISGPE